jgi:hypothetical protein
VWPDPQTFARAPSGGFALLEVLIGFVIATLAIALMVGVAVETLRHAQEAAHYQEATVRAQSRLAETVRQGPLLPGDREGDDGGYRWHVHVTPLKALPRAANDSGAELYAVTVWILWHDGAGAREVRLDTETIGPPAPA